jgi:membrane protease YdiL (CAAX protease family)
MNEGLALLFHAVIVQMGGGVIIVTRLQRYDAGPGPLFRSPSSPWTRVAGTALVTLLAVSPLVDMTQLGFSALAERLQWELEPQALPMEFLAAESHWTIVLITGMAVVLAPLFEELLFRGLLYRSLGPFLGRLPAAGLTAALFAWTHGSLSVFPGLVVLGLGLTVAYELTGSLATPILMHAGFNLRSLLIMTALRGTGP